MTRRPPGAAPAIGKLAPPRLGRVFDRERLFDELDRAAEQPALWLGAAPGAGKSTLVSGWLRARRRRALWLQIDAGDADPATFVESLDALFMHAAASGRDLPAFRPAFRTGQAFDVTHRLLRGRKRQTVAQRLRNGKQVEPAPILLGAEIAGELLGPAAGAEEVVVVHRDVADAGVGERGHHRGFPHPLRQPRAPGARTQFPVQLLRQDLDLADAVAIGNDRQHRLGVARAEQFHLAARHHLPQQRHVFGEFFEQVVQQPTGKMGGKPEFGKAVQGVEEGPVAAAMRVLQHFGKIAHRLVGMHAQQQCDLIAHSGCPLFTRPCRAAWCRRLPRRHGCRR